MKKTRIIAATMVTLFVASMLSVTFKVASASTVTYGTTKMYCDKDAKLAEDVPDTNRGTIPIIRLGWDNTWKRHSPTLQFALPPGSREITKISPILYESSPKPKPTYKAKNQILNKAKITIKVQEN